MFVGVTDCLGDLSAISSAATFVYQAPVVSSVSPGSGTIGTRVTITGSGFDYGCTGGQSGQVFFGGIPAANATVSDGAATAVAPTHGAGPMFVRVTDCLGDLSAISSAATFVYPAPVVSSVSPGSGTIGTRVTITGSGFDYGCTGGQSGQVFFGGIPATDATVTDGAATAVAPTHGAGPMFVRVTDCLGDVSETRRADRYTYLSPGPRFFGLHVYGTESREATVIARLLKPGVLALRVMRVVSDGRLVFAGLVSFGQQPRGRSLIHWNFRINHRLLGPGRYELTLHGSDGRTVSPRPLRLAPARCLSSRNIASASCGSSRVRDQPGQQAVWLPEAATGEAPQRRDPQSGSHQPTQARVFREEVEAVLHRYELTQLTRAGVVQRLVENARRLRRATARRDTSNSASAARKPRSATRSPTASKT